MIEVGPSPRVARARARSPLVRPRRGAGSRSGFPMRRRSPGLGTRTAAPPPSAPDRV